MGTPVRYIDKTRDYYLSQGYEKPYQWAQYDDVPFTPLGKPLSECRVTLISTSEISIVGDTHPEDETRMGIVGGTYTIPSSLPASQLYSPSRSFDQAATTLEDVDAFFPTTHLHAAAQAGRIGGVTQRFHGVFNAYSQRRTRERDAPLVLERCKEDGADVAILVPVCPVCHQTISLVSRHLEANGIPTVILTRRAISSSMSASHASCIPISRWAIRAASPATPRSSARSSNTASSCSNALSCRVPPCNRPCAGRPARPGRTWSSRPSSRGRAVKPNRTGCARKSSTRNSNRKAKV